jgi:hypothetical protein
MLAPWPKAQGLFPDDVFTQLQIHVAGAAPPRETQVAALAILAYFFHTCDIFERGDES